MINKIVKKLFFLAILGAFGLSLYSQGRIIRQMQRKTEDKIIEGIFKDSDKEDSKTNETSSSASNTRGGGLDRDEIDVKLNIKNAETAYLAENYSTARSSVRQAILGIEIEIGLNILNSLPASIDDLNTVEQDDKVTSSGIGFVGLIIERRYAGKDDMEMKVTIGNDAAILSALGMYAAGGVYTRDSSDPGQKQVAFQGYKGVLKYDDHSGYTLSVPFGQSSILAINGINFENEQKMMSAAKNIDIEKIKTHLGEK